MPATPRQFVFEEEDIRARSQEEWYKIRAERLRREGGESQPFEPAEDELEIYQMPDLEFKPPPNWLIKDFVEQQGLLAFYGKPKTGKTAFLASMLWAWVSGKDYWFDPRFEFHNPVGKTKDERKVLYIILEGQASFYARAKAWCEANETTMDSLRNFYVADASLALFQKDMSRENQAAWPLSLSMLWNRLLTLKPDILVIDTFSRATGGIDENSSQVATVVGILDDIRDAFGITTILVHHSPKHDKTTLRGHSSLEGAASSLIYTERTQGGGNNLVLHAFRNAEANNEHIPFTMKPADDQFYIAPGAPGRGSRGGLVANDSWLGKSYQELRSMTGRAQDTIKKAVYAPELNGRYCMDGGVVALSDEPEVL